MKILIVESPNKARTLKTYLSPDINILSTFGHIKDLPSRQIGFNEAFEPFFVLNNSGLKLQDDLKKFDKTAVIYLATDPDREGEGIASHVKEVSEELGFSHFQRILFRDFTEQSILHSLQNPTELNEKLVLSQQARRLLDRMIGFSISPSMQRYIDKKSGIGRVQGVALNFLAEAFEKFQKFKTEEFFVLTAKLENTDIDLDTSCQELKELLSKNLSEVKEEDIKKYVSLGEELLFSFEKENISSFTSAKISPFKTTTLQKNAAALFSFTPEKTMIVAQKLFEGLEIKKKYVGLITYHRTDSIRVSENFIPKIKDFLQKYDQKYLDIESLESITEKKLNVQDSHECIRPTSLEYTPEMIKDELNPDEYKLYSLIYFHFLASCFAQPTWKKIQKKYVHEHLSFNYTYFIPVSLGYFILDRSKEFFSFPEVKNLDLEKINLVLRLRIKKTLGPSPLSEIAMIERLEKNGIGRPSTYATILPKLLEKKYINVIDKLIYVTKLGLFVYAEMEKFFRSIINLNFTSEMEKKLDDIVHGKEDYLTILNSFKKVIYEELDEYNKYINFFINENIQRKRSCCFCGKELTIFFGKYGFFSICINKHKYQIEVYDLNQEIPLFSNANLSINLANKCLTCQGKLYLVQKKKIAIFCPNCRLQNNLVKRKDFNISLDLKEKYICPFLTKDNETKYVI